MSTLSESTGQTPINGLTGKPSYYKDNKATHDRNNARQMYVGGKYISKKHPLHKPGRYKSWADAHNHKHLDTHDFGDVYVIYNPFYHGWFKVGMALDAEDRLKSFQTSCPYRSYMLVDAVKTTNRRKLESKALKLFQEHSKERRGEWFRLSSTLAKKLVRQLRECNEWT